MNEFWQTQNLAQSFGDNIALISRGIKDKKLTYLQLHQEVQQAKLIIGDDFKQLIMIKSSATIETIVFYLAALELKHTVWFVDAEQSLEDVENLQQHYQVNCFIDNARVTILNKKPIELLEDLALLNTTSGSTGSKKLVKISFNNLQANCHSICQCLPIQLSDVVITTLPLHYSFGLSVLNSHLNCGATIVLNDHAVITREFWQQFSQFQVTSFYGVPHLFEMLLTLKLERLSLQSLRYFAVAGGKLLPDNVERVAHWCHQHNKQLYVMYGQTEATARISCLKADKVQNKPSSIGQAITDGKLWLEDKHSEIIEESNKVGELCYQGPNVMIGLAQSVSDLSLERQTSVLHTGDLAYRDNESDFHITGRLNRFVKIQGHRINLDEVEDFLNNNNIKAYCLGNDKKIYCCLVQEKNKDLNDIELKLKTTNLLTQYLNLHSNYFSCQFITQKPLLSSGKLDYQGLALLIDLKGKLF